MTFSTPVRRSLLAGTAATAALSSLALSLPAQAAVPSSISFGGSAYGSTANVGTLVSSGATSYVPMCTNANTYDGSNKAAAVKLGAVGSIGAVTTKASGRTSGTTKTATTSSSTGGTSLLGGLVRASALTSTSVASHNVLGYHLSGSTKITGLNIGGKAITVTGKPNQVITLANIATVTVNGQSAVTKNGLHGAYTNALVVRLLASNKLKLPVGTVVVGATSATLHDPTHFRAFGSAYGTQLGVSGGVVSSGPTAYVGLACGGSAGAKVTNSTAGLNLPGVLQGGAVQSSAVSTETSTGTVSSTQAQEANVNLLGGLVRIDAVTAKATATRASTLTTSSAGTKVVGLKINGKATTVSTAENSKIQIAGVGTLYLNRVIRSGNQIQVYAAELVLTSPTAGRPAGTFVIVGSATAGVA